MRSSSAKDFQAAGTAFLQPDARQIPPGGTGLVRACTPGRSNWYSSCNRSYRRGGRYRLPSSHGRVRCHWRRNARNRLHCVVCRCQRGRHFRCRNAFERRVYCSVRTPPRYLVGRVHHTVWSIQMTSSQREAAGNHRITRAWAWVCICSAVIVLIAGSVAPVIGLHVGLYWLILIAVALGMLGSFLTVRSSSLRDTQRGNDDDSSVGSS